MRQDARSGICRISTQCSLVRHQQALEILTPEKSIFVFARVGERIEANKDFVDEAGMTHDETAIRQSIEKLSHQRAEIRGLRKIIGAGESGIERDIGARSAAT